MTDSQIYDALRKGEEYLGIDRIRLLESKIREFKSIGVQGWGFNRGKDQAERYLIEPMKRNKLAWQVSPDIEKVIQKNDLERLKIVGGLPGELGIALTFRPEKDPVNFLIGLAKQLIRSKKSVKFGQNDWRFRPSALWREYREREHWNEIRGSFILWLGKIFKDEGGWFFTSVLYFRRAYDVVKLILWDGVQINPNKEYVVLGVVDEADNMPIIRVIGIFERASLT